jgi:hypothetical protein
VAETQYYRDTRYSQSVLYWKLEDGDDFVFKEGAWQRRDLYKYGPSWWRLTGEIGIDAIPVEELPEGIPL